MLVPLVTSERGRELQAINIVKTSPRETYGKSRDEAPASNDEH
ncbi:MAG TPA: hypothetical protein VHF28_03185 [Nitrososphaera sp.]|nr:hypothetical protein [Nitrososphaera sp.]